MAALAAPARAQNAARLGETPAGDILADAVRSIGAADVALVPGNALREDGDLKSVAPAMLLASLATAGDSVVVMDVTGSQLLAALERSVAYVGKPFAGFLQVSGLRFKVDVKSPVGARVQGAVVGESPIDPKRSFKVAMPRPLADGQLGYFQIWNKDQIARDTGKTLEDALRSLAATRPAPSGTQGRIAISGVAGKP
ncbi:MAG: 5'-nucleotidase C-terminal domain-containing protein [Armatimonadota bacterium]